MYSALRSRSFASGHNLDVFAAARNVERTANLYGFALVSGSLVAAFVLTLSFLLPNPEFGGEVAYFAYDAIRGLSAALSSLMLLLMLGASGRTRLNAFRRTVLRSCDRFDPFLLTAAELAALTTADVVSDDVAPSQVLISNLSFEELGSLRSRATARCASPGPKRFAVSTARRFPNMNGSLERFRKFSHMDATTEHEVAKAASIMTAVAHTRPLSFTEAARFGDFGRILSMATAQIPSEMFLLVASLSSGQRQLLRTALELGLSRNDLHAEALAFLWNTLLGLDDLQIEAVTILASSWEGGSVELVDLARSF